METRNKSKRESSYKYGRRRSRSLGGCISTEISKVIDKDLVPAERLKLLIEYSLQEALKVAEREICSDLQPAEFHEKSLELLHKIDTTIKSQDLYTLCITGEERAETDPLTNLVQYNEAVFEIDEECKKWDALVSEERERLNNITKESGTPIIFKDPVDCSMYETMDYSGIIDDITCAAGNYHFQVEKLKNFNNRLIKTTEITQKVTKHLQKEASEKFSRKIADTPRTLFKKLYHRK